MSYHFRESDVQQVSGAAAPWAPEVDASSSELEDAGQTDRHDIPETGGAESQQTDAAGEIVADDSTDGRDASVVDPLASTDPPRSDDTGYEEMVPVGSAEGDPQGAEELEGQPTRVEARHDLLGDDAEGVPRLIVIGGADRGREFNLQQGENSIGRGLDNDIVLADIAVSRRHTLVVGNGEAFELHDLGSGNGTVVNGSRVTVHSLRLDDQIELGNSLLRFVDPTSPPSPSVALGEAETQVGEIVAPAAVAPPAATAPEAVVTADEVLVAPRPQTEPRKRGLSRSKKLLLFGGVTVVAFLGLMLVLKAALNRRAQKSGEAVALVAQPQNTNATASIHFDRGRKHLKRREWPEARDEFEKVYGLGAQFEHAKRYIRQAKAELRAQRAMEKAQRALSDGAFDLARSSLAKVPATSVYAAEAPKLKEQIDTTQVDRLLGGARTKRDEGALDEARKMADKALRIAPTNPEIRELLEELGPGSAVATGGSVQADAPSRDHSARRGDRAVRRSAAKRTRASRRATTRRRARSTRRRSRSSSATAGARSRSGSTRRIKTSLRGDSRRVLKRALALYAQREWTGAAALLEQQAESASSKTRQRLEQRARAMRRTGKAYQDALAVQARNPRRAIRAYQQAIKSDKQASGGTHKQLFQGRLCKVARLQAITSLNTGRYDAAYQGVKLAQRCGPVDAQLKNVLDSLERKAEDLFTKGYTLRTRNASEARRLWQRVLRMVPPASKIYQKAYKWLNNSAPDYLDEDEL